MVEIWVCNREQVPSVIDEMGPLTYAHISITSYRIGEWPITIYGANCLAGLHFRLDDVDEADNNSVPINDGQAKTIYSFVKALYSSIDVLLINCEAGISRSAGVASAIACFLYKDDMAFISRTGVLPHPNRAVFWSIMRVAISSHEAWKK